MSYLTIVESSSFSFQFFLCRFFFRSVSFRTEKGQFLQRLFELFRFYSMFVGYTRRKEIVSELGMHLRDQKGVKFCGFDWIGNCDSLHRVVTIVLYFLFLPFKITVKISIDRFRFDVRIVKRVV